MIRTNNAAKPGRILRRAAMVFTAMALAACAGSEKIADQALKANMAVEDSQNRVLLLNILRAAEGKPLYFTSLDQLFGPLGTGQMSADLTLPFDPSGGKTLGLSFTPQRPNYNISVQDSRAFMRGFLNPVAPGIFGYYLQRQGWSPGMIFKLFVQEVLIVDPQGLARRRYANDAQEPASLAAFDRMVKALEGCDLRVRMKTWKSIYGSPVSPDDISAIKSSQNGEMYFEPLKPSQHKPGDSSRYQPYMVFSRVILDMVAQPGGAPCAGLPDDTGGQVMQAGFMYGQPPGKDAPSFLDIVPDPSDSNDGPQRNAIITLRSPEAMIQYLGGLARQSWPASGQAAVPSNQKEPGKIKERIFDLQCQGAEKLKPIPDGSVSLNHLGQTCFVPAGSRSMQVLALVSQVIGLQKESSQIPGISTFRVLP